MKTVLSIDIGIRNLSFCCISTTDVKDMEKYEIKLWNTYNILEYDNHKCSMIQKNNIICNKKCSLKYENVIDNCIDNINNSVDIIDDNNKNTFIYSCKTHFPKNIIKEKKHNFKVKNVKDYKLSDIIKAVLLQIQKIYDDNIELFKSLDNILLELQPLKNNSMKLISHVIFAKYIDLLHISNNNSKVLINFVSASKKLKAYTGPEIICKLKTPYAKRKWLSIQYGNYFLKNKFSESQKQIWEPVLDTKTKIDDIHDVLLMCINSLYGVPNSKNINKLKNIIK